MSDAAHPLEAHTGEVFRTAVGAAFPGTRAVFRGRDIHGDLMHETDWLGLLARGAGLEPTAEQLRFWDTFFVATSYPDARIWCNRVAALAGTTRSTSALALAAGCAVSEATVFGRRNEYKAVVFLGRVRAGLEAGASIADCVGEHLSTRGTIPGYGRPIHNGDERIAPMMAVARELGLADGPHVRLAFAIEAHLETTGKPLRINAGALAAAFACDFGMTPRQLTMFTFPVFLAGMSPCYLEALEKPVGAIYAARCDDVEYTGPPPRAWPRAAA